MKLASAFLLLTLTTPLSAQTYNFSRVRTIINDRIANYNVPSISIAVVKDGKIIWEEGFGYADRENQQKATAHTSYYLASISKTMTATALMKLAEQKLINIDSPVNKYLRGAKVSSTMWDANKATVKMVMSHTSGLTTFNFWCRTDSLSCAKMDDEIFRRYAVLVFPPGSAFDYSNLGYGVLDHVIRDVSGKTFTEYMRTELFQPLGLKNTFVAGNPLPAGRAMRYTGSDGKTLVEFPFSHAYSAGASSIYGSVHDLALFAKVHLNDLKKKEQIISATSVRAMQDTVARNGSDHYGLGWWIDSDYYGYKGVLAQGGTFFSNTWLQLIPSEDIAVAVVTNAGHSGPWRTIINEVLAELLPKFKANLAAETKTGKKENQPTATEPEPPLSNWKGFVRTYKRDVPIVFHFNGSTGSFLDLGDVEHINISKVSIHPNRFSYKVEGDLGLEDTGPGPYNMSFYFTQKGDILYGSAQTSGSAHPDTPGLSFWVELKKVE